MKEFRQKAGLIYRVALSLLGLTAATLQAFDTTKAIHLSRWWELSALIAIGVITFVDNARTARNRTERWKKVEKRSRVQRLVIIGLAELSEQQPVSVLDLGASIWLVPSGLRSALRERILKRSPALVRSQRIRLSDSPQPSAIDWTEGKGRPSPDAPGVRALLLAN
jgi:hypothetical protein